MQFNRAERLSLALTRCQGAYSESVALIMAS
jgi:hypothetical protein